MILICEMKIQMYMILIVHAKCCYLYGNTFKLSLCCWKIEEIMILPNWASSRRHQFEQWGICFWKSLEESVTLQIGVKGVGLRSIWNPSKLSDLLIMANAKAYIATSFISVCLIIVTTRKLYINFLSFSILSLTNSDFAQILYHTGNTEHIPCI